MAHTDEVTSSSALGVLVVGALGDCLGFWTHKHSSELFTISVCHQEPVLTNVFIPIVAAPPVSSSDLGKAEPYSTFFFHEADMAGIISCSST